MHVASSSNWESSELPIHLLTRKHSKWTVILEQYAKDLKDSQLQPTACYKSRMLSKKEQKNYSAQERQLQAAADTLSRKPNSPNNKDPKEIADPLVLLEMEKTDIKHNFEKLKIVKKELKEKENWSQRLKNYGWNCV